MLFSNEIANALPAVVGSTPKATVVGDAHYPSCFHVSDIALSTTSAAAQEAAALLGLDHVKVNKRHALLWFHLTTREVGGWQMQSPWDAIAGDYEAKDGWIRLHTNAPHHRDAALKVLEAEAARDSVAQSVRRWDKIELESAIVDRKGCAAAMHDLSEWADHPQGRAIASEPLIDWQFHSGNSLVGGRSLKGLRVLDLTRVLAGPVSTRFLAGFGADVLRIDPPHWNEPAVELEVTLGKTCAGLDLKTGEGRAQLRKLLREADVLVHGYRPGALQALGFGSETLNELNPNLIEARLCAYGWTGPWAGRRGFDSLVQMSAGIAAQGMQTYASERPIPLPVQALDFATGYLLATAILRALRIRATTGKVARAQLSLARTAHLLASAGTAQPAGADLAPADEDFADALEETDWGTVQRIHWPLAMPGHTPDWAFPAGKLRRHAMQWRSGDR